MGAFASYPTPTLPLGFATIPRRRFFRLADQSGEGHSGCLGDHPKATPPLIQLASFNLFQFSRRHFCFRCKLVSIQALLFADQGDGSAQPFEGSRLLIVARGFPPLLLHQLQLPSWGANQ